MTNVFSSVDKEHMVHALKLAEKATGLNHPNPLVGAVVAKDKKVLGTGYHLYENIDHAETIALKEAGDSAKGATIYISLEPCAHHFRTPPCTEAIIKAGIKRAVFSIYDTDERVRGKGEVHLQAAGIKVDTGLYEERAYELNRDYLKAKSSGLPWVVVKVAMSLDGKIGLHQLAGEYFSSNESLRLAHELRAWCDGIMVGAGTIRVDNPRLTCRLETFNHVSITAESSALYPRPERGRNPVRISITNSLDFPREANFLDTDQARSIVITSKDTDSDKIESMQKSGVEILLVEHKNDELDLKDALSKLVEMGIMSVMVEGGGRLIGSIVSQGLVDEFYIAIAPILIGGVDSPTWLETRITENIPEAPRLTDIQMFESGKDFVFRARINK